MPPLKQQRPPSIRFYAANFYTIPATRCFPQSMSPDARHQWETQSFVLKLTAHPHILIIEGRK
jgi:hypothetical protein